MTRGQRDACASRAHGFTLIEMIVVLVILGLALTIVAGFLPTRNTTLELSSATFRIAGVLRLARSRAVAESRLVTVAAVPGGHGFQVDNAAVAFNPKSVLIVIEPREIVFAPDGSASGGAIRVSVDGRQCVISVDWLTGRVSVAAASAAGTS